MQPQQQINLPMKDLAGFAFNVGALIAIDVFHYQLQMADYWTSTDGLPKREIILHLVGPISHTFTDERADQAYLWYLQLTGQARIAT